jgi:hypothetical protein
MQTFYQEDHQGLVWPKINPSFTKNCLYGGRIVTWNPNYRRWMPKFQSIYASSYFFDFTKRARRHFVYPGANLIFAANTAPYGRGLNQLAFDSVLLCCYYLYIPFFLRKRDAKTVQCLVTMMLPLYYYVVANYLGYGMVL